MRRARNRWLWVVFSACILFSNVLAQDESRKERPGSASSADEAALRALAQEFYAVYAKKDLDGFLQLWSAKSPELASRRTAMQKLFADRERIEVKGLAIRKVMIDGEKAKLRVDIEMSAVETQTGKPASGFGPMKRAMQYVKEENAWKVWHERSAEEDLAVRLAAAKTENERNALLSAERELTTVDLPRALVAQGNRLRSQGNFPQALIILSLAHTIAEQIDDKSEIARALSAMGVIHSLQGNHNMALQHFQKSLTLREALGDKVGIAASLNNIGNVLREQGAYNQALESYQKSLTLSEASGDKAGTARASGNIANVHNSQGNYAQSLVYYQKSLALFEALESKADIALTFTNIGGVYSSQGAHAQALEYSQKSLVLFESLGDKAGMALTLNSIGEAHSKQSNYAQALDYYMKSSAISEAVGYKALTAHTLYNIGIAYFSQGNYVKALEHFQKSLTLHESLGDNTGIASMLSNIAKIHFAQSNYTQALEYYQKISILTEALGDKAGIAQNLNSIGAVHKEQGSYIQALEHYRKSLTLYETLENKEYIPGVLSNIGEIHREQGNYTQALEFYQKSLALSETLGSRMVSADTLNNIGAAHSSQGAYAQALEYYQKSLALNEQSGNTQATARTLHNIGNVYREQRKYNLALEHYQKSLTLRESLGDKAGIASTLSSLGVVHRLQGDNTQALQFAERAAAIAREVGAREKLWSAVTTAGKAYRALNQPLQARRALEEAVSVIETLRTEVAGGEQEQQRYFEDKLAPYRAMIELLTAQTQSSEALVYAERAKARVLLDVLRSGRINSAKTLTTMEQEQERGFNNQLVSLNTQILRENLRPQPDPARLNDLKSQLQKARLDYEAFQTGLYAAHPELKAQRGEAEILTLGEARDLLPDTRSALLEYAVTDERTYLFALTGNAAGTTAELKVYPLEIKRKELGDRAARFRETLAKGSPGFRRPARELYDLLLKPAAAQLQGRTSLIIVPDGELWELPFHVLQPAPNRYLIEDCAVAYAPSLTALRDMIKSRDGRKDLASSPTLLAFGNPELGKQTISRVRSVLMDEKLDPLPEAERQVNVLKQIYGASKSKVYTGVEAREERAKAEARGYRILHLATHGILNDSNPMYSHVLLAQAEGDIQKAGEDGLLEAWEIMKLDLKADLAVLSACETARGRVGAGEGMIGLSWALFVAGCPTTVVSQWKVDSASTTELMLEFHRQLKAQMAGSATQFSAARALRVAAMKLQRSREYRHPFYWAGFVVAGKGF